MSDSTSKPAQKDTKAAADSGTAQVAATLEEAQEVGYLGVRADPEPDDNYTVQGQATRTPPAGHPGGPPKDA